MQDGLNTVTPQSVTRKPLGLKFHWEWPKMDEGGLQAIAEWIDDTRSLGRQVSFVAIDMLQMIRPAPFPGEGAYAYDYRSLTGLKELGNQKQAALLVVHHSNKAGASDPQGSVSGTMCMTGAVDASIVIQRGQYRSSFHVRVTNIPGKEMAVRFSEQKRRWTVLGDTAGVWGSENPKKLLEVLEKAPQ